MFRLVLLLLLVATPVLAEEFDLRELSEFQRFLYAAGADTVAPVGDRYVAHFGETSVLFRHDNNGRVSCRMVPGRVVSVSDTVALSIGKEDFLPGVTFRVFDGNGELTPQGGVWVRDTPALVRSPDGEVYVQTPHFDLGTGEIFTRFFTKEGKEIGMIIGRSPVFVGGHVVETKKLVGTGPMSEIYWVIDRLDLRTGQVQTEVVNFK